MQADEAWLCVRESHKQSHVEGGLYGERRDIDEHEVLGEHGVLEAGYSEA